MTTALADFILTRPPETDDELYELVYTLWGVKIPRTPVCAEHQTPFAAFADAFFGRSPVSVWKGSRGFGGKSRTLAYLALTEAVVLGAEINLLGGSLAQSTNIHEAMRDGWDAPLAPNHMVVSHGTTVLRLTNGAKVRPLTASQRTVRGPHPQRLRLDEIDEMDITILDAAMGQPMPKTIGGKFLDTQTVMSSTHQYPDKTMTEMLNRAVENGWPVFSWCYKETSNPVDGWLSPTTIERKRQEVSAAMFAVEYDLQEPSIGTRAIDTEAVEAMFSMNNAEVIKSPSMRKGGAKEQHTFEQPTRLGEYVTGADWAKEQDYTVISTWRTDCTPWRLVKYTRLNRRPWPVMVGIYNDQFNEYGGKAVHDGTGVGNVVNDYIDSRSVPFIMSGRQREEMLTEYIAAVERGDLIAPRIESAYTAHKYASVEDVYGGGKDAHLPDEMCSFALAWTRAKRRRRPVTPIGIGRLNGQADEAPWETPQEAHASPWRDIGGVKMPADTGFSFTV
jgi:hypothetical protein